MNTLSINEAAQRYGIPQSTLSGWVGAGLVRIARKAERRGQPTLIFERDVAELAQHYRPSGGGRGARRKLAELVSAP